MNSKCSTSRDQKEEMKNFRNQQQSNKLSDSQCIFGFTDFVAFLNAKVATKGKYSQGPYNLKKWSQRLGYRSPSSLAMVLNRKRLPTSKMINLLCEDFNFNESQSRYFSTLVEIERQKDKGQDVTILMEEAKRLSGNSEYQNINYNQFNIINEWFCFPIRALTRHKNFENSLDWIAKALRNKVSKTQIKTSIEGLIKVGLIKQDPEKGLIENQQSTHTGNTIPSSAIRNHHKSMLKVAIDSIEEQTIDNRMIQGLTIAFNKERKEDAFKDIAHFINEFNHKYGEVENVNSVYQLGVQFFEHTSEKVN